MDKELKSCVLVKTYITLLSMWNLQEYKDMVDINFVMLLWIELKITKKEA